MFNQNFSMTGTTGSTFTGVLALAGGRIGVRDLGDGTFRVRVEPANGSVSLPTWSGQPSYSQNRFSIVVEEGEALAKAVAEGVAALAAASISTTKKVEKIVVVEETVPAYLAA